METLILIGDELVKNMNVVESHEPMIDLVTAYPELTFDHERLHVQKESSSPFFARASIGEKLIHAQSLLPSGLKLLIKECYRPMWVQKAFWEGYFTFLQKKFPHWSLQEVYNECSKLSAPLEVAPHTTGGAVDLTLIDSSGNWLEMGTEFNATPIETNNATYTNAENISDLAKFNRMRLVDVMRKAGFVNYPTEWWHWSYGDKYWALMSGFPNALYSSIELPEKN
jgi:D-alanyl-D-alanine dipeptidase